jgi:hypothetical protein
MQSSVCFSDSQLYAAKKDTPETDTEEGIFNFLFY